MDQLNLIEPEANCYSGIRFVWANTLNLCGKTIVEIWIDSVKNQNGDLVQTPFILNAI